MARPLGPLQQETGSDRVLVGRDAGDDAVGLVADQASWLATMATVEEGEGRGGVAGGRRNCLASAGETAHGGIAVVDDPGGAVGIEAAAMGKFRPPLAKLVP